MTDLMFFKIYKKCRILLHLYYCNFKHFFLKADLVMTIRDYYSYSFPMSNQKPFLRFWRLKSPGMMCNVWLTWRLSECASYLHHKNYFGLTLIENLFFSSQKKTIENAFFFPSIEGLSASFTKNSLSIPKQKITIESPKLLFLVSTIRTKMGQIWPNNWTSFCFQISESPAQIRPSILN